MDNIETLLLPAGINHRPTFSEPRSVSDSDDPVVFDTHSEEDLVTATALLSIVCPVAGDDSDDEEGADSEERADRCRPGLGY